MHRRFAARTLVALAASLLALPALAERPLNTITTQLLRTQAAICAKADADGDTYRPFVCEPRCDCLAPILLQATPSSCDETSAGVFGIVWSSPGECVNGHCNTSFSPPFGPPCHLGGSCPSGTECVPFGCFPGLGCASSSCLMPCGSSAVCPALTLAGAQLSGVSTQDSPDPVQCEILVPSPAATKINSNDALECLAQVEAITGPCQ